MVGSELKLCSFCGSNKLERHNTAYRSGVLICNECGEYQEESPYSVELAALREQVKALDQTKPKDGRTMKAISAHQSIEMQKDALSFGKCPSWRGEDEKSKAKPTKVGIDATGNAYPKYPRFY